MPERVKRRLLILPRLRKLLLLPLLLRERLLLRRKRWRFPWRCLQMRIWKTCLRMRKKKREKEREWHIHRELKLLVKLQRSLQMHLRKERTSKPLTMCIGFHIFICLINKSSKNAAYLMYVIKFWDLRNNRTWKHILHITAEQWRKKRKRCERFTGCSKWVFTWSLSFRGKYGALSYSI